MHDAFCAVTNQRHSGSNFRRRCRCGAQKKGCSACSDITDSGLPSSPGGGGEAGSLQFGSGERERKRRSGNTFPLGIAFAPGIAYAVPGVRLGPCGWKVWAV
ncbi:hypothetical protein GGP41_003861 [Bipolaris sorokiniana]|uniref:Uncharacterized protein n=1 Tax=Cochliobolus sativus TaxID=45130 RepID=A0A8H5ZBY6_COCSA|nr:hypothetical protein GGP41_003861 [Bipolaris sorokiniana]